MSSNDIVYMNSMYIGFLENKNKKSVLMDYGFILSPTADKGIYDLMLKAWGINGKVSTKIEYGNKSINQIKNIMHDSNFRTGQEYENSKKLVVMCWEYAGDTLNIKNDSQIISSDFNKNATEGGYDFKSSKVALTVGKKELTRINVYYNEELDKKKEKVEKFANVKGSLYENELILLKFFNFINNLDPNRHNKKQKAFKRLSQLQHRDNNMVL